MLPARTLQTADPCARLPSPPPPPPPTAFSVGGCWGRGGAETWGAGLPDSCICVFAKEDRVGGGHALGAPSTEGFCPALPQLTLCPHVGGSQRLLLVETLPNGGPWRSRPPELRRVGVLVGLRLTASGPGPWEHLAQAFYTFSVTFLFYFTLITIIQEYSQISLGLAF